MSERWTVDACPDAVGYSTIRIADESPNGDTESMPIATVYAKRNAALIARAPDLLAENERLRKAVEEGVKRLDDIAHRLNGDPQPADLAWCYRCAYSGNIRAALGGAE